MSARSLPAIVERHAHDASFLWALRDAAVSAPHFTRADLARLDDRLDAHLDGLIEAGPMGAEIARAWMASGEAGALFAAAVPALARDDHPAFAAICDAVSAAPDRLARELGAALAWIDPLDPTLARARVDALLASADPASARAGVIASAITRRAPGAWLGAAANAIDAGVRARALRAAGELGAVEMALPLAQGLDDLDEACRAWSAWSGALLGDETALARVMEIAIAGGKFAPVAISLAAARAPLADAIGLWRALAATAETRALAVLAAGAIGDAALVPWLIEEARAPSLARSAGEAIARITGVDLGSEGLAGDPPPGSSAGPSDDPGDGIVEIDPHEHLPFPDAVAIARWWEGRRAAIGAGVRRLAGEPIAEDVLARVIARGPQRLRVAASLELAALSPRRGMINVKARADRRYARLMARASREER